MSDEMSSETPSEMSSEMPSEMFTDMPIDTSADLSANTTTAAYRVGQIDELLRMILEWLPIDALLRARRVSRRFDSLVEDTSTLRQLHRDPQVDVFLDLPATCSLSSEPPPMLEVKLVLRHNRPLTITRAPAALDFIPPCLLVKYDKTTSSPQIMSTINNGCPRLLKSFLNLNHEHESRFLTLLPDVPHLISWNFRSNAGRRWADPHESSMAETEIGAVYVLKVITDKYFKCLVGRKEPLLAARGAGKNIEIYGLRKELPLVGQNEVEFTVVA